MKWCLEIDTDSFKRYFIRCRTELSYNLVKKTLRITADLGRVKLNSSASPVNVPGIVLGGFRPILKTFSYIV